MQAMEILKRCRNAENEIIRIESQIRRRRDLLGQTGAPAMDPNRGGRGSSDPDKTGRILGDIDLLERALEARKQRKAVEEAASIALTEMAPELEGKVLYRYYVKRDTVAGIARKEKYTEGYIRKVRKRGEEIMRLLSPEKVATTVPRWYIEERRVNG